MQRCYSHLIEPVKYRKCPGNLQCQAPQIIVLTFSLDSCSAVFPLVLSLKNVLHVLCLCRWFQLGTNPHTGAEDWLYTGGYFDRSYTDCPSIY